jgi:3',5'-cyclic AMP phosphodiesterase CpdA
LLLHAGDLINTANSDAEWGEWFQAGGWINGTIPSVVTPGNHEYYDANAPLRKKALDARDDVTEKNAKDVEKELLKTIPRKGTLSNHWRRQFTLPENGPAGLEETVYYLDYQGVRIVSLNSNETEKDDGVKKRQVAWLEQVLADNPNRWTVLTFHHPVFSTARKRDNASLRKLWQPVFDKFRVDLVLTGHDHSYGRSGLLQVNEAVGGHVRDRRGGTVYCVSVSGPKLYELNQQEWMVQAAEGKQLYQVITVDGNTLRYQAHTATGALFDRFELRKQPDGHNELIENKQLGGGLGQGAAIALLVGAVALLLFGWQYLVRAGR